MQGVTFDTYHSYNAWGLLLKSMPVITQPKPKEKLVEVPGSDLVLDLTEALTGKVQYSPREIKCVFMTIASRSRWPEIYSDVMNAIHGKRLQIVLDNDPDYYYVGRISVGEFVPDRKTAALMISATVEPYKHERHGNGRRL